MSRLRTIVLSFIVLAITGCTRRAPQPTRSGADVEQCIQGCHADQQEHPEETPYDCRAACEEGEMRS